MFLEEDEPENKPTSSEILDLKTFLALRDLQEDGQPDILQELVRAYVEDSQRLLEALRIAVALSDLREIKIIAHTLKGSSNNLGAYCVGQLCLKIELQAGSGNAVEVGPLLDQLERDLKLTVETMTKFKPPQLESAL